MKARLIFGMIIPVLFCLYSCKKEKDCQEKPQPLKGNLIRIQQGTDPAKDTVKLIRYDSLDRISTVVDSIHLDTMYAFYDNSSRLSRILEIKHAFFQGVESVFKDSARFTYNANGLLIQADYTNAGQKNRLIYEYNNGVVAKNNYYTDAGSGGAYIYFRYFIYEVTGGNITNIKEYSVSGNNLVDEKKLTYGPQLNVFKNISLFNFANKLGTQEIINYETYFCNNIITGYVNNSSMVTMENSFNDQQKPVKIVSKFDVFSGKDFDYVFTRFFAYN